jgi:hypothetical protein
VRESTEVPEVVEARRSSAGAWPALPLSDWRDSYATLHRYMQIVGKTRLHFAPMQNHWWHTTLYLTTRGLGTSPMPSGARTVDVEFDFVDHQLVVTTSDARIATVPLVPRSVAEFYHEYLTALDTVGIHPHIWPVPVELADVVRLDEDVTHASYDPVAAHRCWRVLAETDRVLKQFRGAFLGKSSPSHFWGGSFDLSCTRFSGKRAPQHPGGVPNCPDFVTREAYSHECISVGWWPGSIGGLEEPAFYAYAYPEPPGCPTAHVAPDGAYYHSGMHEWILPYDAVRGAADPDAALLAFCQSTYAAAADRGHWKRAELERQ